MPIPFNSAYLSTLRPLCARRSFSRSCLHTHSLFSTLRLFNTSPKWSSHDNCTSAIMAPKQATLGYVKSSQTTLGCGDTFDQYSICNSNADDLIIESSLANQMAKLRSSNRSCPFQRNRTTRRKVPSPSKSQVRHQRSKPSQHQQQRME
jgi:hypothetical protein